MKALLITEVCGLLTLVACSNGGSDPAPVPVALSVHGGDAQVAEVGMALPIPAAVRAVDDSGNPTPGIAVVFTVTAGAGSVSAATVRTGADGVASVAWTLGTVPGVNSLEAAVSGLAPVTFSATSVVGPPASLTKRAGDAQVAPPGAAVATPPEVGIVDRFGNPVANVVVDFVVTAGGGTASCSSATTDATGRASCARWVLGKARGTNSLSATAAGLAPAVFTATVPGDVVLDLGHAAEVSLLKTEGARMLSQDLRGHWVLWDVASRDPIARSDSGCPPPAESGVCTRSTADLAGLTLLITSPSGFEVRDASDGRVLSRVKGSYSWARLASDGSYVYAGADTTLSAWDLDGRLLFSKPGDYSLAKTSADVDALRVADGPTGPNVIETMDPFTGTSSVGPAFQGAFHSWFTDGQRFITNLSTTVWVYSRASTNEASFSLPTIENLTGQGTWLWTYGEDAPGYQLSVYRVDGGGAPAATFGLGVGARVFPGKNAIGVALSGSSAAIVDLSGASPSRTDHTLPIARPSIVAATSSSQWVVANTHGVILDVSSPEGAPRHFGLGGAWSIAGGGGRGAVATASGTIVLLDAVQGTVEGEIAFPSSKMQLSSDGAVLVAAANANDDQYAPDRTLKIFSLPLGTETRSLPFECCVYPTLADFTLSASGRQLGLVLASYDVAGGRCDRQVSQVGGGALSWTGTSDCKGTPLLLSPTGNRVAFSSGDISLASVTNLYQDGALVTAVSGRGVGWIDDSRILVNRYGFVYSGGRYWEFKYQGAEIYDTTGTLLASLPLPELSSIQPIGDTAVYSPERNTIFSLATGAALWAGPRGSGPGAIAGGRVVYPFAQYVLSEPY